MVVKPEQYDAARDIPKEITLSITTERRKHVGAFVGSIKYKREREIATIYPHAVYYVFTFGYKQNTSYERFLITKRFLISICEGRNAVTLKDFFHYQ